MKQGERDGVRSNLPTTTNPATTLSLPYNSSGTAGRPRIVITGATKNGASTLVSIKKAFRHIRRRFDLVKIIFFENDSTDHTLDVLKSWKSRFPIHIESEKNLTGSRTEVLAHARNRLWELVREVEEPFDYVLSMDMDMVNRRIRNMEECWNLPPDWTACCVNTRKIYYDLWALRTFDDWMTFMTRPDGRLIPLVLAIGNHDVVPGPNGGYERTLADAPFFTAFFAQNFADGATYKTLRFGTLVELILLDSAHATPIAGRQTEWLEKTLSQPAKTKYRLACYHVPAYPAAKDFNRKHSVAVREHWVPLFDRYGVDV